MPHVDVNEYCNHCDENFEEYVNDYWYNDLHRNVLLLALAAKCDLSK